MITLGKIMRDKRIKHENNPQTKIPPIFPTMETPL